MRVCVVLEFLSCAMEDSEPVLVFVSKLFALDKTALPQHQARCVCVCLHMRARMFMGYLVEERNVFYNLCFIITHSLFIIFHLSTS